MAFSDRITGLKERANIVHEIGSRIPLRKKGNAYFGHCPWHVDKHASLAVFEATQTFKCFSCGQGRDVIDFIARFYEVDFKQAMQILSKEISMDAPKRVIEIKRNYVDAEAEFLKYKVPPQNIIRTHAESLGILPGSLNALDVRVKDNVLVFPMRDGEGKIIGLRFRAKNGRKWSLTDARSGLFLPRPVLHKAGTSLLAICEGPTDTAALLSSGIFAIGRPSCLGQEDLVQDYIKAHSFRECVIISDNDEPGLNGAKRLQSLLSIPSRIWIPETKDIREFYREHGAQKVFELLTTPF